jgi:tetratricopeptide (TPR) repeat protein
MIWTRLRALPVSAVLFLLLLLLALSHVLTRLPPAAAVSLAYGLVLLLPGWLLTRWLCADMPLDLLERVGLAFPLSLALLIVPASAVLALHLNLTAFQWAFSGLALLLGLLALRRSPISGLQSPVSGLRSLTSNLPLILLLFAALLSVAVIASRGGLDGDQIAYLGFARVVFEDRPLTGLDPLFGTGLSVPPRAALNPWGIIPAFLARVSGADLADALGRYLPAFLALSALASLYLLVRQLTRRRDLALFLTSFQVLFFLAAPFHRHGNLAYAFFRRIVSDKFMLLFVVLPVALALVQRALQARDSLPPRDASRHGVANLFRERFHLNLRSLLSSALPRGEGGKRGEVSQTAPSRLRRDLRLPTGLGLAALGSLPLIIHPIDTAFFAVAAGTLAGLAWLIRPSWAGLRRSLGVGAIILGLLIFPFLLRQQVEETRSAYLFPTSFANLPLQEAPELILPFVWQDALQMPGLQPPIVTPAPGAPNPFLLYRLWSQINGQGLLIFSPARYMSHPDLLWDAGTLLALLLAPLALLRVRRSPLARFILATTIPFLLIAFTPWLAPIVGRVVTPWMLYRFTWPLPLSLILGAALFYGLAGALKRVSSRSKIVDSRFRIDYVLAALLIILILVSVPAIQGRMQTFAATLDVPRNLPASVETALRQLPDDAVILSDYETNQVIPATVSRRYVVAHRYTTTSEEFPAARQPEAIQRSQDVDAFTRARFVDGPLLDTLARYQTDLILLRDARELAWQLRTLATSSSAARLSSPESALDLQVTRLFAGDGFELYRVISPTTPSLVLAGNTLLGQQRWTEAADAFRQALAQADSAIAQYGLGQALLQSADYAGAADAFSRVTDQNRSDLQSPFALASLARIAAAQARPAEALALYARATAADNTHGDWFQEMGDLALLLDQPDAAAAAYASAIGTTIPPGTLTYFSKLAPLLGSKGLTEPAVQAYQSALQLSPNDLEFLTPLGNLLRDRGRLTEAEAIFRRALAIDPTEPDGYVGLAVVYHRQGRYAEADAWYGRAVIVQQARLISPLDTLLGWGQLAQTQGQFDQARAHFQRAVRMAPQDARAYIALGDLTLQSTHAASAADAQYPAVEAAPAVSFTSTLTVTLALTREAEDWYRQAIRAAPRDPDGYATLAHYLQNQGRLADALASAQQGVDAMTVTSLGADEAYQALGDMQQAAGHLAAAVVSYHKAIEINPRNVGAHVNLARVFTRQGAPTRALAEYQAAVRAAPYSAWALSALAAANARAGDAAAAQTLYRRAIAADQTYVGAFVNLAQLLAAQRDPNAAANLLANGLQANPTSATLLTAMADLERSRGDFEIAQTTYQAALRRDPTASAASTNLSLLFTQRGDPVRALATAEAAVKAAPLIGDGWVLLGNVRRGQGDLPGALAAYRQATSVAGGFLDAYLALADALIVGGQPAEAAAVLAQGLQAAPGPELYAALGNLAVSQRDANPTAAEQFAAALASDQTFIAAHVGLANARWLAGEPAQQIAQLRQAVALNPASAWARTALAAALRSQGAWAEAEAAFKQALTVEPLYVAGYTGLAAAYLARGERDAAWAVLQTAVKMAPADATVQSALGQWYLHGGRYADARAAFRRAKELDHSLAAAPLGLAQAWLAAGDRDDALAVLTQAAQALPTSADVWLQRGKLLEALPASIHAGEDAAHSPAAMYRQAAQRDQSLAAPWLALAAWRQRIADPDGAQKALTAAANLEPQNPAVAAAQAEALRAAGEFTSALTLLLEAQRRMPGSPDLPIELAGVLSNLRSPASGLQDARAWLEQALALNPASSAAALALADLDRQAGRLTQAEARLLTAVELDPANPGLLIALAGLEARRDPQAAQARLQEAVRRNPALGWPLTALAARELVVGEASAAETHLLQAAQVNPAFGGASLLLGQVYQRQGRTADAESVLQGALAFDAANTSAAVALADLFTRQGRITETVSLLQDAIANNPAAGAPLIALGNFLQDHPAPLPDLRSPLSDFRSSPASAPAAYALAIAAEPLNADGYIALANWQMTLGARADAWQALEQGRGRLPNDLGLQLTVGQWYLSGADTVAARAAFSQAVSLDQSRADGWLGLAQAQQAAGERTLAAQALSQAMQADPTDPAPWLAYTQGLAAGRLPPLDFAALHLSPDLQSSILLTSTEPAALYAYAATLNRTLAAPYLGLAAWYQRQGAWPQVTTALDQAAEREPTTTAIALARAAAWRQQNRPDLALTVLTQTLQTTPGAVDVMVALADLSVAGLAHPPDLQSPISDLPGARVTLEQALALSPGYLSATWALAGAEVRAGQLPAAIVRLRAALSSRPGDVATATALADLYQAAAQPAAAEAVLLDAQARQPASAAVPLSLAALYRQQGQPDKARRALQQAAALAPLTAAPWIGLAQLETTPAAVRGDLAAALAADPGDSAAPIALGQYYLAQGDLPAAEAAFERSQALSPTNPGAYVNLAQVADRAGQPAAVRAQLAAAVAAAPASGWARVSLGNAYRSQGDITQAQAAYRAAIAVEPTYLGAYTALAAVFADQGRFTEAQAMLQTAAALDASDPAPVMAQARTADLAGQADAALRFARAATERAPASGWAWATVGDLTRSQGKLDEAARAYRTGIGADPLYSGNFSSLSSLQLAQGQPTAALATLQQGLRLAPNTPTLLVNQGSLFRRQGQPDAARRAYEAAVAADAGNASSLLALGQWLETRGNVEAALARYQAAARLPGAAAIGLTAQANARRNLGQMDQAVALYRQALASQADFFAPAATGLDQLLLALGREDEGLRVHLAAVAQQPTSAAARVALGDAYRRRGRLAEAVQAYRVGLDLQPGSQAALLGLAGAQQADGRLSEAEATLQRAVALKPGNASLYLSWGDVRWAMGDAAGAQARFTQALALDAGQAAPLTRLGTLAQLQGRPADALSFFQRAVDADPINLVGYIQLGQAQAQAGDYDGARATYARAAAANASSAIPLILSGNASLAQNDAAAAAAAFQAAIQAEPGNIAGYINLSNIYRQDKQFDDAFAQVQQAQRLNPGSGWAWEAAGNVLRQQRKLQEAISLYEQALQRDPRRINAVNALIAIFKGWRALPDYAARYETRLATEQKPAWIHAILAGIYQALDQIESAIRHNEALTASYPEYPDPWFALARFYQRTGDGRRATAAWQRYLALMAQTASDARLEAETSLQQLNLVVIESPAADARLRGPVTIVGTAAIENFQYYKIEMGAGEAPTEWSLLSTAPTPVNRGILATWDTDSLPPGIYTLRLTAVDITGNFPPPYLVRVEVTR